MTSCYDNFVRDYDYSAVFAAYQYDLRSFVLGEDASFQFQVALGGVMDNDRDRKVTVSLDDALVAGAVAGMKDKGKSSGDYVGSAITAAGISALKVLPPSFYTLEGMDGLTIRKGSHTAAVTVKATDAFASDPDAFKPAYAIAFRIDTAEADTILMNKDYAVIAVKCENRFFGFWTRRGMTRSYDWMGNKSGDDDYESPSLADSRQYELTTVSANSVSCNKVAGSTGQMTLTFDGSSVAISSDDGKITGTGSSTGLPSCKTGKSTSGTRSRTTTAHTTRCATPWPSATASGTGSTSGRTRIPTITRNSYFLGVFAYSLGESPYLARKHLMK